MDFSSICRTCLSDKCLQPIFKSNVSATIPSNAIFIGCGIQVVPDDNLPQNMCRHCTICINNILKFRMKCKDVERKLLNIKNKVAIEKGPNITNEDNDTNITRNCSFLSNDKSAIDIDIDCKDEDNERDVIDIKNDPDTDMRIEEVPFKFIINQCNETSIKNDDMISNNDNTKMSFDDEKDCLHDIYAEDFDTKNQSKLETSSDNNMLIQNTPKTLNEVNIETKISVKLNKLGKLKEKEENKLEKEVESIENDSNIPFSIITEDGRKTRVKCRVCFKELSIRSIDMHMIRTHPGQYDRKVKCELCDNYIFKDKLNRHRRLMHGITGFKCGYCKIDYKYKEVLLEHYPKCSAKKRKRGLDSGRWLTQCDICQETMQKASLGNHKAVKHAGLRPVCEHCGKSFGNKFRLDEHCRAKHGYEKIKCKHCDFQSAGVMNMRNHERLHRGEKPFVCETCGAKFHAAYLLNKHKYIHQIEKPHKCDICSSTFKTSNSLYIHNKTCHSNSLYTCILCSKTYKCRQYALRHIRITHKITGKPHLINLTYNYNRTKELALETKIT